MGAIIQARNFSFEKQAALLKPIIFCCSYKNVENKAISINVILAEKLMRYGLNRRTIRLEQCFTQVLETLPDEVIIKDFDVMFHPEYKVDILKILITACRRKNFSIIWPGTCKDGMLIYAEEGYSDYKAYKIDDYDITCIV